MFGWFKRKETTKEQEESAFTLPLPSVKPGTSFLGPSLQISGKITGEDDVQLRCRHEGSIELSGDLVIQDDARVSGSVVARNIMVSGQVDGDLRARKMMSVYGSARITGTLATPKALVEEGAFVEGKMEMDGSQ